jgi:hypothetical protein
VFADGGRLHDRVTLDLGPVLSSRRSRCRQDARVVGPSPSARFLRRSCPNPNLLDLEWARVSLTCGFASGAGVSVSTFR